MILEVRNILECNSPQYRLDSKKKLEEGIYYRMKRKILPRNFLLVGVGVGVALVTPLVLYWIGVVVLIDNELVVLGFDAERVTLLDSILLTLLSSLVVGFLIQRSIVAWIGGFTYFVLCYLLHFIQQALHPGLGPDGQAQILLPEMFRSVLFTLHALGLLSAGVGAVIGKACGQVLIVPVVHLVKHLLAFSKRFPLSQETPSVLASLFSLLLGGLLLVALFFSATGVGSLLMYGPTTSLYRSSQLVEAMQRVHKGVVQHGTFSSPTLGNLVRNYWIYLPPSYNAAKSQHYPTFYLLHGSPGGPQDWFEAAYAGTTADALLAQGKIRETILVGADGNGSVYRFSEWANSFDGRQPMEDAIVHDLVSFIDSHYRTLAHAADRTIGGLSMGGYGAMNIALHHPDIFHKVMTLGGYFQAEGPVFGKSLENNAYRQVNSPSLFLHTPMGKQSMSQLMIVIGIGTSDGYYYREGLALYQQLMSMRSSVHLFNSAGGHSWVLWAKQFGEALPLLEPPLSRPPHL